MGTDFWKGQRKRYQNFTEMKSFERWKMEKNQVYICMYHKNVFEKMKVDEKECSLILFNTLLNEN